MLTALKEALGLSIVSFPVLYIQGNYIGGADEAQQLHHGNQLRQMLESTRTPFVFGSGNNAMGPVRFCTKLAGADTGVSCSATVKWYCFQVKMYANVVRAMSAVHVMFLVTALVAGQTGTETGVAVALAIGGFLSFDLFTVCLLGPTPFSPIGCISTWAAWKVKGNAVTAIPYKVVFVYYLYTMMQFVLTCGIQAQASAENSVNLTSVEGGVLNNYTNNQSSAQAPEVGAGLVQCWQSNGYSARLITGIFN